MAVGSIDGMSIGARIAKPHASISRIRSVWKVIAGTPLATQ